MADRRAWLGAASMLALVVLLVELIGPATGMRPLDARLSSVRTTPDGARALFLALPALGIPVAQRRTPLVDADSISGPLALLAPEPPPSPRELRALKAWVAAGGTLVYAALPGDPTLDTLGLPPLGAGKLPTPAGDSLPARSAEPARPAGDTAAGAPIPEAARAAAETPAGGPLPARATRAGVARDTPPTPLLACAEAASDSMPGTPAPARAAFARGRAEAQAAAASAAAEGVWIFRPACKGHYAPSRALLLSRDSLPLVLEARIGRGRVLAVSDARALTNARVREYGVAPLVARFAAERAGPGRPLVFDEYHHGLRGGSVWSGVEGLIRRHDLRGLLLQLGLVVLLALLTAARRFGSPLEPAPAERRSPLEHVDALAQLYRGARAWRVPRLLLLGGLARRLGRPRPRSLAEAETFLARVSAASPAAGPTAARLARALRNPEPRLAPVARGVDRLLRELRR